MKFNDYAKKRNSETLLESAGTNKNDIRAAAKAMKNWVESTAHMIDCLQKVPEMQGELGGMIASNHLGERTLESEIAMEVQRARYVVAESSLDEIADRLNQFASRISSGIDRL